MTARWRSVLYVPGINEKAMNKAVTLAADAVVLDLEDSVSDSRKGLARDQVEAFMVNRTDRPASPRLVIRVNGLDTPYWEDDLAMAARARPDAVLLPKVDSAAIVQAARARLGDAGISVWCMVENPLGVLRLERIVEEAGPGGIDCLVLGTNDLIKETDIEPGPGRMHLLPWFARVLIVAKSHGVPVIDGVLNDIGDLDTLREQADQARAMGMAGKTVIHPAQIDPVNRAFSPTAAQMAAWRRIVAAFEAPEHADLGVINLDGQMVERLHLAIAVRQLAAFGDLDEAELRA